ncbi:MAG: hypothetical protein JJU37_16270 [Balneolaceae bacterium]|nr:hypothetical protein [Balneolaceae bacterium]
MSQWIQALDKLPTNSLLVSTSTNQLIRFYCPIPASCIAEIAGYKIGDQVLIHGIDHNETHALLYLIDGLKLPHHYFHIQYKP